jgi:hypothetical protein
MSRRPVPTFGYIHRHFMMSGVELASARRSIVECAISQGSTVRAIFVDEVNTAPAALVQLIEAITERGNGVVIVPSLLHLSALGNPLDVRRDLHANGFEVHISDNPAVRR